LLEGEANALRSLAMEGADTSATTDLLIEWRLAMLQWALIFLVVAVIAGLLGLSGIAGTATNIAWILFLVGLVVAAVLFFRGRSTTP
jgi:uncharacterized membrane protein YtjA (UPF0391 family)